MRLKMSSAKLPPFCVGRDELQVETAFGNNDTETSILQLGMFPIE